MAVTYASFETKRAFLSTPFGLELAMKKTGMSEEELEKIVGRYKRGVRKGLLKGYIQWMKTTRGGWVKMGPRIEEANGFVCKFIGINFCFGIYHQEWRKPDVCLWGDDPEGTMAMRELSQKCREKQEYIWNKEKENEKISSRVSE